MMVRLTDLSIDEMVGALCFGCCQAHLGLPVGFLLLLYSVLSTVESLLFQSSGLKKSVTGLSPPVKYFTDRSKAILLLWIFYGFFFCLEFAMPLCSSVYMCLVVTCWARADLLALVCGVLLLVCHFPIGILGQV